LSGLGEAPGTNPELRAELEAASFEALLHELRERDPAAHEKIDKQNPRRVIRAVEVIRLTGKKFSEQRAEWKSDSTIHNSRLTTRFYCFTRPPADLHARINARVDAMFARGLVDETRELVQRGLEQNKTAMQAIGYRQVVEHLRGERPLAETIELVKSRTRQFAKRQLIWFRRQLDPEWIELNPDELLEECSRKIAKIFLESQSGKQWWSTAQPHSIQ
jgi:tRNA dimethylallyltransferase